MTHAHYTIYFETTRRVPELADSQFTHLLYPYCVLVVIFSSGNGMDGTHGACAVLLTTPSVMGWYRARSGFEHLRPRHLAAEQSIRIPHLGYSRKRVIRHSMQRLLSFLTLLTLLGLVWFFVSNFRIDGLEDLEVKPREKSDQVSGTGTSNASTGWHPLTPLPEVAHQGAWIKMASFYIDYFGESKAGKPHVMGIIAAIIQQFDIVAIQGIRSDKGEYLIRDFVRQINTRSKRHYQYVIGPRLGQTNQEQYAFVYDAASVEADLDGAYTISDPANVLLREPLVVPFRVRGPPPDQAFTFTLINIHIDPNAVSEEMDILSDVYHAVRRASRSEDDIIILGHMNHDDRHLGRLGEIPGIYPVIQNQATNTLQTQEYDNIILHKPSTSEFSGHAGVLDMMRMYNLNTQQALTISDHLPIWAEFSLYESIGTETPLATRPGTRSGW